MKEQMEALRQRFESELQAAQNSEAVEKLRVAYLGKKGSVTELLKGLKSVAGDQKKEMGQLINQLKRQVEEGVDVSTVVEKGKAAFVGPELIGKSLGVIGLGAIGSKVANIAIEMGMHVLGYDPYLSVDYALALNTHIEHVTDLDEVFRQSDYLTMHLHYNKSTANIIDEDAVKRMKGGVRVINLARGGLVNDDAIIAGLESGRVAKYITDFPHNRLVQVPNVIAMPHLGASTPESEANCAAMAAQELRDYLENGNISNSVNLPNLAMRRSGECRICCLLYTSDAADD